MKEVFLAFAFNEQDRDLANQVQQLLAAHDVRISNGKNVGGKALTPAIKEIIDNSDGLIALLTKRDKIAKKGNKYRTHDWVKEELDYAKHQKKPAIALIERGVEKGGMYGEDEYISFDRGKPLPAFLQLSETIGRWKREAGRLVQALILPDDLGAQLWQQGLKIRYRLVPQKGKAKPDFQEAEVVRGPGGTLVYLWGVKEDDSIHLEVTLDKKTWRSDAAP